MNKNPLVNIPNIGETLADKLWSVGVRSRNDLVLIGSEETLMKLSALENSGVCINMLYALEGAVQGIRWHKLDKMRKHELLTFYRYTFES